MQITVACPSYKRVESMRRLVDSGLSTCSNTKNIDFVFYLDNDDYDSHGTAIELMRSHPTNVKAITGPKIKLSDMWNQCANYSTAEIVMLCGDDIIFRTINWDVTVIETFQKIDDKIAFVHGDDGYNGNRFGTHGFLHRNWINTTGYFLPPYFSADWCDTWINEVADKLGRRLFIPIVTEHMHFTQNKGPIDLTHIERLARDKHDRNQDLYLSLKTNREIDYLKLKAFISEFRINKIFEVLSSK